MSQDTTENIEKDNIQEENVSENQEIQQPELTIEEQLQEELATTENKVSFSRQFYNETVRSLNTAVKTIPTSFFVGLAKVGAREFYEVDDPTIRNAPNVKF